PAGARDGRHDRRAADGPAGPSAGAYGRIHLCADARGARVGRGSPAREATMTKVFVTHPRNRLPHYFGPRATQALKAVADARFNPGDSDLSPGEIANMAADCDVIIAYRQTAGDEALFAA